MNCISILFNRICIVCNLRNIHWRAENNETFPINGIKMASSSSVPADGQSATCPEQTQVPNWLLASNGIKLLINNRHLEAEELFLQHADNLVMFAGYSIAVFMDALMSFEEDKLNTAITTLKEVEKRCAAVDNAGGGGGWFKSLNTKPVSLAVELETQIIYADSQVCIAILTFLQQDISGYFKGGWVLRKAWKVYQRTYKDILQLYKENVGELLLPESTNVGSLAGISQCKEENPSANGYTNKLPFSHSYDLINSVTNDNKTTATMKKSITMNCALSANNNEPSSSKLAGIWPIKLNSFNNLSYLLNLFHDKYSEQKTTNNNNINKETIVRLMGAISFGYGLFQLGISLLPPSIMKLINLLGFNANRQNGIACLMYARQGMDMRAPLATLSLLWYHTIVRPFYAIDGANVQAGVEISMELLHESEQEFEQSALFLFFKGRIYRLKSDIKMALCAFQQSVANSQQREIRILAMHEVAWCHLIELDYKLAQNCLLHLRVLSRWSRPFYTYLAAICIGCVDVEARNGCEIFNELKIAVECGLKSGHPLDEFLLKRYKLLHCNNDGVERKGAIFFKLLLYEMLYLWNALPSCSCTNIERIIIECESVDNGDDEPMIGLSNLIAGCCYVIKSNNELAIGQFRKCIEKRKSIAFNADDVHISAFSQCELADLLIKMSRNVAESKQMLQQISRYSRYDFDSRLNVRVHALLKNL